MELKVENNGDRLVLGSEERNHTLFTLLKQSVWDGGERAGYDKGHPYRGEARLVINADEPDEVLESSIERAREQIADFREAFEEA